MTAVDGRAGGWRSRPSSPWAIILVMAACAFADSFEALVVLRFLTGMVAAAVFPMALTFVGDSFAYRDRPAAISALATSSAMAQLLSLALGGILAGFVSWRAVFLLDGSLALL